MATMNEIEHAAHEVIRIICRASLEGISADDAKSLLTFVENVVAEKIRSLQIPDDQSKKLAHDRINNLVFILEQVQWSSHTCDYDAGWWDCCPRCGGLRPKEFDSDASRADRQRKWVDENYGKLGHTEDCDLVAAIEGK